MKHNNEVMKQQAECIMRRVEEIESGLSGILQQLETFAAEAGVNVNGIEEINDTAEDHGAVIISPSMQ
jgi:hypothetical protein